MFMLIYYVYTALWVVCCATGPAVQISATLYVSLCYAVRITVLRCAYHCATLYVSLCFIYHLFVYMICCICTPDISSV
jgi:hypothetical protein